MGILTGIFGKDELAFSEFECGTDFSLCFLSFTQPGSSQTEVCATLIAEGAENAEIRREKGTTKLDGIVSSPDNPHTVLAVNIEAYLQRINYSGSLTPSVETLRALQVAHLRSVPFENLSIHSNEPIVLTNDALFTKIVERRRGGFCYELNGLFSALLRALGFQVVKLAAGVAKNESPGSFGPIFDHMTLMVTLEERWLVDVGFGDSFLEPLRLDETEEQFEGTQGFRIIQDNSHRILLRRNADNDWKAQYRFTLDSYNYPDYEDMCRFHQTSPDSHFTRGRLCSRATEDGRITLSGMKLITTKGTLRLEDNIASPEEYDRILREVFGVVMK